MLALTIGAEALQLAKYAGFSPIISTASLWHTGWLKDRGATHLVDRHLHRSATLAEIELITQEPIEVVFDAVSETGTQTLGYSLLAPGGCLLTTLPTAVDQGVVKITPERRIEEVYGNVNVPESRELGISLYSKLTELLANEVIRVSTCLQRSECWLIVTSAESRQSVAEWVGGHHCWIGGIEKGR